MNRRLLLKGVLFLPSFAFLLRAGDIFPDNSFEILGETPRFNIEDLTPQRTWSASKLTENDQLLYEISAEVTKEYRDIPLKLLNVVTGDVSFTKIRVFGKGRDIQEEEGFDISVVSRANNSISWNDFNTQLQVNYPANLIVIKNLYPIIERSRYISIKEKNSKGKTISRQIQNPKYIRWFPYVPHSESIHKVFGEELQKEGKAYLEKLIADAYAYIRSHDVKSRFNPGSYVTDVPYLTHEMFVRLTLVEQMDYENEFQEDALYSAQRVLEIIGANKELAYTQTGNYADARGLMQYTPPRWKDTVRNYPKARLTRDFVTGTSDHLQSMVAAILLHDENLAAIHAKHGGKILEDINLIEEYLAVGYNAGIGRSVKAFLANLGSDPYAWIDELNCFVCDEPIGYVKKIRALRDMELLARN